MTGDISVFAVKILQLCLLHDCSVSSWVRTAKRNASVGGSIYSQHLLGLAVDLVPDEPAKIPDIMRDARRLDLVPIDEWEHKKHIHVQAMKAGAPQ